MNLKKLTKPAGPWFHLLPTDAETAWAAGRKLESGTAAITPAVRVVRGSKATTTSAFFDEISAALQFPPHFGENWDALHDCLGDLRWLDAAGIVLVVTDAARLLDKAPKKDLDRLAKVLTSVAQQASSRPFHVLLASAADQVEAVRSRWQALLPLDELAP